VMLAVLAPRFDGGMLAINLVAIAVGLLMGKGIGMFFFRRAYPTTSK